MLRLSGLETRFLFRSMKRDKKNSTSTSFEERWRKKPFWIMGLTAKCPNTRSLKQGRQLFIDSLQRFRSEICYRWEDTSRKKKSSRSCHINPKPRWQHITGCSSSVTLHFNDSCLHQWEFERIKPRLQIFVDGMDSNIT